MSSTPPDPGAFFRQFLGQWEQMTNSVGGGAMKSGEFARTMHGAGSAAMNAQDMGKQFMERALAAANMPSRTELEDLSARIGRVEAALFRIEAILMEGRAAPVSTSTVPEAPGPARTRKPPEAGE